MCISASALRGQKVSDILEEELQVDVSHLGAGIEARSLEEQQMLLMVEPSPAPNPMLLCNTPMLVV